MTSCSTCRGRCSVELRGAADLANEMVGFQYHHDLDLTGFIDGTENPTLVEATDVALIPDGVPGTGGSVLLLQQWEHDATAWESLPVPEQEQIMGRRKADSAELDPAPESSHVGRTDQEEFGKIFRRTWPTGRSPATGRSSSASAAISASSRPCSKA